MPTLTGRLASLELEADELLEEHAAPSVEDFRGYRGPEGKLRFYREGLKYEPMPFQEEIALAVEAHKRVVVRGGHAVGKERSAASEALYGALVKGQLVLLLSATERQVIGQLMREVRQLFRSNPRFPGSLYTSSLRIDGEPRILAFAGSSVSALTGWHDPNGVLVIISEGQGERLEDFAYDAALACATDDLSRVLILGNPVRPSGRFYEASRSANWHSIRVPVTSHPNVTGEGPYIPGGPSPSWPEEMRAEYGAGSPFYVSRILAQFPETGEDSLVKGSWLDRVAEEFCLWKSWGRDEGEGGLVMGVDIARYGSDRSVCAVRRGDVLTELFPLPRGRSTMEVAGRLVQEMRRLQAGACATRDAWKPVLWHPGTPPLPAQQGPGRIVIDEIGVGGGVLDRIQEVVAEDASFLGWEVSAFNSSRSPEGEDSARYLNTRAQAYWRLRRLLETATIGLLPHPELRQELMATSWRIHSSGKIVIAPKDELRSALGRSPDFTDATAMAFSPPTKTPGRISFSHARL